MWNSRTLTGHQNGLAEKRRVIMEIILSSNKLKKRTKMKSSHVSFLCTCSFSKRMGWNVLLRRVFFSTLQIYNFSYNLKKKIFDSCHKKTLLLNRGKHRLKTASLWRVSLMIVDWTLGNNQVGMGLASSNNSN